MELKPCPFCGAKANLITRKYRLPKWIDSKSNLLYSVICTNRWCGSRGYEWYPASMAMEAWNRRTPPDTPSGEDVP